MTMILEQARVVSSPKRVIRCLEKLRDHIELENCRMRYMTIQNKVQQSSGKDLKKSFEKQLKDEVDRAQRTFETQIQDTQQKLQRNYISILGILAAVVIAFTSGAAFSSSVLENLNEVGPYRLLFMVLLIGFFMFNLISALFVFLNRISTIDNKPMRRLIAVVDLVIFVLLAAVATAWAFGIDRLLPLPLPF